MISRFAVAGYRSLRDLVVPLGRLTIVRGANGSGKSSLYRALRLLGEVAQGRLIGSLAAEGGLPSAMWAGPETFSREMRAGRQPIEGVVRSEAVSLRLGFAGDDLGYAIDLGFPENGPFKLDAEIKIESMWSGGRLTRSNLYAERLGPMIRLRRSDTGEWRTFFDKIAYHDSMVTHSADPTDGVELLMMRERIRQWRFYDSLRTDRDAPARHSSLLTYTPVLAGDGGDLAAAMATVLAVGNAEGFEEAIADAFPGSRVTPSEQGVEMRQHGLLRPLQVAELSDGTLRYLLLATALFTPRPPEIMVLNEPEASLHPALIPALGRLLALAAVRSQIIVVSHSEELADALRGETVTTDLHLRKELGETRVECDEPIPSWEWPKR